MTHDAFTSAVVTNTIARRAVREAMMDPPAVIKVLQPVLDIVRNRKLSRTELRPTFDAMLAKLQTLDNISDLRIGKQSKSTNQRMSANESYQVRFFQTSGDREVIRFFANEIELSRRQLVVFTNPTHFYLHPHMLARYMQREKRPHTELLRDILRPMRASCMLKQLVDGNIALATDDGLLLGTSVGEEFEKSIYPAIATVDRNGLNRSKTKSDKPQFIIGAMIMTYIDRLSMGEAKERLLDRILEWERAHRVGIARWFEMEIFDRVMLGEDDTPDTVAADIKAAQAASLDLIKSPQWQKVLGA